MKTPFTFFVAFLLVIGGVSCKKNDNCENFLSDADKTFSPYAGGDVLYFLDTNSADTVVLTVTGKEEVKWESGDGCQHEYQSTTIEGSIISQILVYPGPTLNVNSTGTGFISCEVSVSPESPEISVVVMGQSYDDVVELTPDVTCLAKKILYSKSEGIIAFWPNSLDNGHFLIP